jgi:hypothetical protein
MCKFTFCHTEILLYYALVVYDQKANKVKVTVNNKKAVLRKGTAFLSLVFILVLLQEGNNGTQGAMYLLVDIS